MIDPLEAVCFDCSRPYGEEHGFPDLVIPYHAWVQISPDQSDAGLLCPSCICKRLMDRGITCEGAFMSGPIRSVTPFQMSTYRAIENIELALDGRENRWGDAISSRIRDQLSTLKEADRG